MEQDPEEPPSLEELQARYQKAEKIRNILARSRSAFACSSLEVSQTPCQVITQPWETQARLTGQYFARFCLKRIPLKGVGRYSNEKACLSHLKGAEELVKGSCPRSMSPDLCPVIGKCKPLSHLIEVTSTHEHLFHIPLWIHRWAQACPGLLEALPTS